MRTDEVLKQYLSDNARYADLINGMVFDGRQVVKPDDLSEMDSQVVDVRYKIARVGAKGPGLSAYALGCL